MATPRRKKYRPWNPAAYARQAFTPADRLPEGDLVFFLLDLVPQLDLDPFYASYEVETRGQPPFDPALLVCLWLYAYAIGVYSSRKIAAACERNLAFLAIVGDDRPDFRTISDFRKEHLERFADLFLQVLRLAHASGLVQLGLWATDGSKVPGNASRHKAMSYGYMQKEVERLRGEIADLLRQAQQPRWAPAAATNCPRSCASASSGWPRSSRPRHGWRSRPRRPPKPSAAAGPSRRSVPGKANGTPGAGPPRR
jgi:transposase